MMYVMTLSAVEERKFIVLCLKNESAVHNIQI